MACKYRILTQIPSYKYSHIQNYGELQPVSRVVEVDDTTENSLNKRFKFFEDVSEAVHPMLIV